MLNHLRFETVILKPFSKRRAFTALMSLLATAFVIGIWRQRFSWQSDFLADLLKIGLLIAVSTAVISFVMWTLTTHRAKETLFRGALAGALTALIIIPLPTMAWAFKTEFINLYQSGASGVFEAIFGAVPLAIKAGLLTFVDVTKASLIAVLGSLSVGAGVVHYVRPKT